jgi:hypothetical protein
MVDGRQEKKSRLWSMAPRGRLGLQRDLLDTIGHRLDWKRSCKRGAGLRLMPLSVRFPPRG